MSRDPSAILKLRVPLIVRIGHRRMPLDDVLSLGPGAIIELSKLADDPLDLLVNNKEVGQGNAVKIGENFGIRVTAIGDAYQRLVAMTGERADAARPNRAPARHAPAE